MTDTIDAAALAALDGADALAVFATERINGYHPIDPILARVRQEVDAFKSEPLDLGALGDRKRMAR